MVRCFVGIPLPETYQHSLVQIVEQGQKGLRSKITWTKKGNWHMTLFFLGDVLEESLPGIQKSLAEVSLSAFKFKASGGGFFPSPKNPRVIWVGVNQGVQQCSTLSEKVSEKLVTFGFEPQRKPFKAHLTLGRIKKGVNNDNWSWFLRYLNEIQWPEITIDSFVLWQSQLKPQGPDYLVIQEYPLLGQGIETDGKRDY